MSATAARPSGWYADATDAALLRYWDGSGWTPHTTARPALAGLARPSAADGPAEPDGPTRALEPGLTLTARLPHDASATDHTTVPTLPDPRTAWPGSGAKPERGRMPQLAAVGAITAAASLVVAVAALGVALGR